MLLQVLPVLMKAIPAKYTLAFTQNLRISCPSAELAVLLCTDGDTCIAVPLPATDTAGLEGTACCVPAKPFFEITKSLNSETVTLSRKDSMLYLNWDSGHAILPVMEDEYTDNSPGEDASVYRIPADRLDDALKQTTFAVGTDELRPTLKNIFLNFSNSEVEVVASDSRVLMCHNTKMDCDTGSFLLPEPIAGILRMIPPVGNVEFTVDHNRGSVKAGLFTIGFRPGTGKYPGYKGLFPTSVTASLRMELKTLLQTIKRIAVCDPCIRVHIERDLTGGSVTFSSVNTGFMSKSTETLPCDWDGEPMDTAFKASTLADLLSNCRFENVCLGFIAPNRPVVITEDAEDGSVRGIIVPIAIPKAA